MQGVQVITQRDGQIQVLPVNPQAPLTRSEFEALHLRRVEINDQIGALRRRRNQLDEQQHVVNAEIRPAIVQRIAETDQRVLQLESQLDRINDRIANAPVNVLTTEVAARPRDGFWDRIGGNVVPLAGMFSVFFLMPIAIGLARLMWKRASAPVRPALVDQAAMQRLEQLQQAVDTIAIEVERISEGQRFVSRIMSEREPQPVGAGPVAERLGK